MPLQIFKPSYRPADCTYLVQYIAQFQLAEGNVSFSGFKAIRAIAVKIAVQNRVQSCLLEPRTTDAQRGNSLHCTAKNSLPLPNF